VDLNLHGTGTRANNAMEDIRRRCRGGESRLCSRHGFMPGCLGVTEPDPSFRASVLLDSIDAPVRLVRRAA
jgi:3-oxoacyl-[acyl-carrier-protein] synthase I